MIKIRDQRTRVALALFLPSVLWSGGSFGSCGTAARGASDSQQVVVSFARRRAGRRLREAACSDGRIGCSPASSQRHTNLRSRLPRTPRKWLKRPETLGRRQTRLHECDPGPQSLRTASRNLRPARRRAKPTTTCCEPDAPRATVLQLPKDPPDHSTDCRKSASATRVHWSRIFIIAGSIARGSSSEAATTVGALLLRITYCTDASSASPR